MKYAVVVAFVIGIAACARAQVDGVPRDLIEQRIEAAAEQLGGESDVDLTNLFEVLTDRYLDPIDLNHTDAQELSTLLLLSDVQIGDLLQHVQAERQAAEHLRTADHSQLRCAHHPADPALRYGAREPVGQHGLT